MNKVSVHSIYLLMCFAFLVTIPVVCGNKKDDDKKENEGDAAGRYAWYAPTLPDSMSFAGEPVPMDKWYVQESFDRQLISNFYHEGGMIYLLKKSYRYFPMIEERLKANGIPDDMKYLCVAESHLANVVSRVGAAGFWQFMKGTSPAYGLRINADVDERYHIEKSTDAACKYLQTAYKKFGSWTAAAASYNCGMGGYNGNATFQNTYDYYDLYLPEETNQYIFRILALKHIISNANKLGFMIDKNDGYVPQEYRTIPVKTSIPNLARFAADNGSNYKELKLMNPWLTSRKLTVAKGQSYELKLPK